MSDQVTLVDLIRELSAMPSGLKVQQAEIHLRTDLGSPVSYRWPAKPVRPTREMNR